MTRHERSGDCRTDSFDCLGIGLCPLDRILLLERYPAPEQKTESLASRVCGGGPIPNAVYTMAVLGSRAAFIGKVGGDREGSVVVGELKSAGVDTSGMIISPAERTASAHIWVERGSGRRTVVLDSAGLAPLKPEEILRRPLENCRFLLLDGRGEAALHAARIAKAAGAEVVMDLGSMRHNLQELLKLADIVIASQDFARAFNPGGAPAQTAEILLKKGLQIAVVTLGEYGCVWQGEGGSGGFPAFEVEVLDTTGAGDAFHGGFAHGLAAGWGTDEIVEFAAACGALACTVLGGRGGVKSEKQVRDFIKSGRLRQNP